MYFGADTGMIRTGGVGTEGRADGGSHSDVDKDSRTARAAVSNFCSRVEVKEESFG